MNLNKILASDNTPLTIGNLLGILSSNTVEGVPLGTVGNSAVGELGLKVLVIGGITIDGATKTPVITTATENGTVTAGAKTVEFEFSTDFAGTVLGATYAGAVDAFKSFVAYGGDTLSAIAYTISAGSARITRY